MNVALSDICVYRNESLEINDAELDKYVSTDSMVPNRGGVVAATSLPCAGKVKTFKTGDTLVSNIRPYFKKIWKANRDGCCSNDVLVFRANKCLSDFLYWTLSSDDFFAYVTKTSKGTKMPRGDKNAIMQYEICLPSRKTQEAICNILAPIQELIETNFKQNDYLAEMLLTLQKQIEETGELSESRADEVFNIHIGKTPPRKEPEWFSFERGDNVIWMSIKDMGGGDVYLLDSSEYLTSEAVDKHRIKKCKLGSVLLSFKLTVGRVGVVASEMVTNEAIACFSSDDPRKLAYLYPLLKSYDYASLGSTSSIATAVNSKTIKAMPIKMPSSPALDEYYNQVKPIYDLLLTITKETTTLTELRDALLPRLMSGEIDVSNMSLK